GRRRDNALQIATGVRRLLEYARQPPETERAQHVAATSVHVLMLASHRRFCSLTSAPRAEFVHRWAQLVGCRVAADRKVIDHGPQHCVLVVRWVDDLQYRRTPTATRLLAEQVRQRERDRGIGAWQVKQSRVELRAFLGKLAQITLELRRLLLIACPIPAVRTFFVDSEMAAVQHLPGVERR